MKWPIIFMLVGQSLDGVSTGIKLHQGCVEMNPVTKNFLHGPIHVAVWKTGFSATAVVTLDKVKNKTVAKTAAYTIGAMGLGAAIWNFNQECK